jgi:hypothetical protein
MCMRPPSCSMRSVRTQPRRRGLARMRLAEAGARQTVSAGRTLALWSSPCSISNSCSLGVTLPTLPPLSLPSQSTNDGAFFIPTAPCSMRSRHPPASFPSDDDALAPRGVDHVLVCTPQVASCCTNAEMVRWGTKAAVMVAGVAMWIAVMHTAAMHMLPLFATELGMPPPYPTRLAVGEVRHAMLRLLLKCTTPSSGLSNGESEGGRL